MENCNRKKKQQFDKNARLIGLTIFKDRIQLFFYLKHYWLRYNPSKIVPNLYIFFWFFEFIRFIINLTKKLYFIYDTCWRYNLW